MARAVVRVRPLRMVRDGSPALRRTGPARRVRLDEMGRVRTGPAVRQVLPRADRVLVTSAAGAPRAMNRAATAGPRSETVRTAAREAVLVAGRGRQRPGLGGMLRTAAATARIRTAVTQSLIAAGPEQTAPVLVVPALAGRAGIGAVPVVPTVTATAPTGRVPAAPVPAAPTVTATAPTGRARAAPTPTGTALTGRVPAGPVPAVPTVTATALTGRAAVALRTALVAVGRRQALVTAVTTVAVTVRRGRPTAAIVTGRRSALTPGVLGPATMTGAAVEVVQAPPTRRVRLVLVFPIRLLPTSSPPRHGPSSTACRTTWPTA